MKFRFFAGWIGSGGWVEWVYPNHLPLVSGRRRPREIIWETIKKDLKLNGL